MSSPLDQRPIVVALAGPNGAGKTTFYYAHLQPAGLRFVNADLLARELGIDSYAAAVAASIRQELIRQYESFVFETVFSDPVGDKVRFLVDAAVSGNTVLLCFIGNSGPEISEERVAMRVSQADMMCRQRSWSAGILVSWQISTMLSASCRTCGFSITTICVRHFGWWRSAGAGS